MNLNKNSIITLSNDKQYEIVDRINYKNNTYLLLTPTDKVSLTIVKVRKENDKYYFDKLTEQEYNEVILKIKIDI